MTLLTGTAGQAERLPIETFTDRLDGPASQTASLGAWLLRLPGQAVWSHYQLTVIHLRDIPNVDPARKDYPEAQYEMMMYALNPERNPNVKDPESFQMLTPANWMKQFHEVTDEQAVHALEAMVDALVKGILPAEIQGWRGGKELWDQRLQVALLAAKA